MKVCPICNSMFEAHGRQEICGEECKAIEKEERAAKDWADKFTVNMQPQLEDYYYIRDQSPVAGGKIRRIYMSYGKVAARLAIEAAVAAVDQHLLKKGRQSYE